VKGEIDWDARFDRMRCHSGEHVLSGVIHGLFGYDNVGCHFGKDAVTVDFSGWLSAQELERVERLANAVVISDVEIRAYFPTDEELKTAEFRSKLDEFDGPVRLVEIPGCDVCACCAMHVKRTGEIGLIKILDCVRRKEGVRLRVLCGGDAYEDYRARFESVERISALLSAKPGDVVSAVERLMEARDALSYEKGGLVRRLAAYVAASAERSGKNVVIFEENFGHDELRLIVNAALPDCGGICAAFSGDDGSGYRYVIGSSAVDLRAAAKNINAAISGRGGGDSSMIQGNAKAPRKVIEDYFKG
jgi:alanyl-tRNA synthetase